MVPDLSDLFPCDCRHSMFFAGAVKFHINSLGLKARYRSERTVDPTSLCVVLGCHYPCADSKLEALRHGESVLFNFQFSGDLCVKNNRLAWKFHQASSVIAIGSGASWG